MKKTIVFSLILFSASVFSFAQNDTTSTPAKERLKQIEDMTVEKVKARRNKPEDKRFLDLNTLDHFAVGFHSMDISESDAADVHALPFTTPSREYALNILTLSINPCNWLSLTAGADIKWDQFGTKDKALRFNYVHEGEFKYPTFESTPSGVEYKKHKSLIKTTSFSFPLLARLRFGDVELAAGAEYSRFVDKYNRIIQKDKPNDGSPKVVEKGITLLDPTRSADPGKWNWIAGLTCDGFGVYFKYSPVEFADAAKFKLSYFTVGLVFSM